MTTTCPHVFSGCTLDIAEKGPVVAINCTIQTFRLVPKKAGYLYRTGIIVVACCHLNNTIHSRRSLGNSEKRSNLRGTYYVSPKAISSSWPIKLDARGLLGKLLALKSGRDGYLFNVHRKSLKGFLTRGRWRLQQPHTSLFLRRSRPACMQPCRSYIPGLLRGRTNNLRVYCCPTYRPSKVCLRLHREE